MPNPKCEICREKDATKSKTVTDERGQKVILTCDDCFDYADFLNQ